MACCSPWYSTPRLLFSSTWRWGVNWRLSLGGCLTTSFAWARNRGCSLSDGPSSALKRSPAGGADCRWLFVVKNWVDRQQMTGEQNGSDSLAGRCSSAVPRLGRGLMFIWPSRWPVLGARAPANGSAGGAPSLRPEWRRRALYTYHARLLLSLRALPCLSTCTCRTTDAPHVPCLITPPPPTVHPLPPAPPLRSTNHINTLHVCVPQCGPSQIRDGRK